jgi:hypothetical protein
MGGERRLLAEREKGPYRLIVEGVDDLYSIINLMGRHGLDWEAPSPALPHLESATGIDELLKALPRAALLYERFGIVVDADLDHAHRWLQVHDRLKGRGVTLPEAPSIDGVIVPGIRSPTARIGVWLMPDNQSPGILEDFLARLVPADNRCWRHAEEATTQARALGAPLAEKDQTKGALHAWLAWQSDPGVPFGMALRMKVLGHDSPDAVRFAAWFKRLFLDSVG